MSIKEQFEACENDVERWELILDSQHFNDIEILIDNDQTFLSIPSEDEDAEEGEREWLDFNYYLGDSSGIVGLLDAIGIECGGV